VAVSGIGGGAPLTPISLEPAGSPGRTQRGAASDSASFGDTLLGALESAHHNEQAASGAAERFAAGDPSVGIHETLIAAEKANISVRFAVTLKNKVIEAYRELMNTPV
jgi:flagellar hook-basal body complex protein FliE